MYNGNNSEGSFRRLMPRKASVPVNFICMVPDASAVSLVGDFNDWQAGAHPMQQHFDGSWQLQVQLPHGHHRYAFAVDGKMTLDPRAQGVSRDANGQRVSLIAVS